MKTTAHEEFTERIDDVVLLAIAAAGDEGVPWDEFLNREIEYSIARLAERDLIQQAEE
jgi:hypothetical protein